MNNSYSLVLVVQFVYVNCIKL